MLTRWLTLIFLLSSAFILISSDGLSVTNVDTEEKCISTDAKDVNNHLKGESDSLPNFNDSETLIESQKILTLLNHQ